MAQQKLRDRKIWETADKVKVTESDDYERQYPERSLARVTLRLHNGKSYSVESDRSANSRYLRPTDADIQRKFRLIATAVLGKSRADKVVSRVGQLEMLADVGELTEALRPVSS